MVGQIVWAVVVAVLLVAVSVGWAIRGAVVVREALVPPKQRGQVAVVHPALLTLLSGRATVFAWCFLLAFALLFLTHSMGRAQTWVGAMVLAFAYALLSAMLTGFTVWVRAQRSGQGTLPPIHAGSFRWAAWVGLGVGVVTIAYLVVDVVTSLTL
ncbi:hypothetical protein [Tessaracoccus antarcticus]|uniref:Uncharacterized protein n=1 Tax=Tessaracoccus antarcticus TaxID=2479848 RepID=A0A3M0G6E0_9ACTN|nr:hypothetical protein [Tessaracoccus antarcticus]RMB59677.1 hypothetical protein EAX62_07905 [Tessaracoccus antarcticus]